MKSCLRHNSLTLQGPHALSQYEQPQYPACVLQPLAFLYLHYSQLQSAVHACLQEEASMFGESEYGNAMSLLGVTEVKNTHYRVSRLAGGSGAYAHVYAHDRASTIA